ncbi:hypothetical protein GY26_16125 [Gammaproteobacteria bacterium MFB021]|nr:hypothetical protein GY26_16125 [Gammaproteobacteria bacterium MFB021]
MHNTNQSARYHFRVTDESAWGFEFMAATHSEFKTGLLRALSEYRLKFGERRGRLTPQVIFNGEGFMILDRWRREIKINESDVYARSENISAAAFDSAWGVNKMIGGLSALKSFLINGESNRPKLSLIKGGKYDG